jgi:hypothetical protein
VQRWIYNLATAEFTYGGQSAVDQDPPHDPATEGVVQLSQAPDVVLERYNGAGGIRAATAQEILDRADRLLQKAAITELEVRALKAALLVVRAYGNALKEELRGLAVLLIQKGTITAQDAQALKRYDGDGVNDVKTIDNLKADYAEAWKGLA